MKRLSIALLSGLLLTLLIVVPVSAKKPTVEQFHFDDYDHDVVDCTVFGYDFKLWDHAVGDGRFATFYDANGTPIEERAHISGVDNFFNPNDTNVPPYTISGSFAWNLTIVPGEPVGRATGAFYHITLPGSGNVFLDAGQGTWTSALAPVGYSGFEGHHELDQALCDALKIPSVHAAEAIGELNIHLFLPTVIGSTQQ